MTGETMMASSPSSSTTQTQPTTPPRASLRDPSQGRRTSSPGEVGGEGSNKNEPDPRGGTIAAGRTLALPGTAKDEGRTTVGDKDGAAPEVNEMPHEKPVPLGETSVERTATSVPRPDDSPRPSNKRRGKYERDEKRNSIAVHGNRPGGAPLAATAPEIAAPATTTTYGTDGKGGSDAIPTAKEEPVQPTAGRHLERDPSVRNAEGSPTGWSAGHVHPSSGAHDENYGDGGDDGDGDGHGPVRTPRTSDGKKVTSNTVGNEIPTGNSLADSESKKEGGTNQTKSEVVHKQGEGTVPGIVDEPRRGPEQSKVLPPSLSTSTGMETENGTILLQLRTLIPQLGKDEKGTDSGDAAPNIAERSEHRMRLAVQGGLELARNATSIEAPELFDVLCGPGKKLYHHRGNRRMRKIAAKNTHLYTRATTKEERTSAITTIVNKIKKAGARFLKRNDHRTGWIECNSDEINQTISEAFQVDIEGSSTAKVEIVAKSELTTTKKVTTSAKERIAPPPKRPFDPFSPNEKVAHLDDKIVRDQASSGLVDLSGRSAASLILPVQSGPSSAAAHTMNIFDRISRAANDRADIEIPAADTHNIVRSTHARRINGELQAAGGLAAMVATNQNIPAGARGVAFHDAVPPLGNSNGIFTGPPQPMDVVVGREALMYSQEGNFHLQNLVRSSIGQDIIPTELKLAKARAILDRMHQLGSRFCIKETNSQDLWYKLSDVEAQDVIFRGLCEEEKRIQIFLISPKATFFESAGAGRGWSLPVQHPDIASYMLEADPASRSIAQPDPDSSLRGKQPDRASRILETDPSRSNQPPHSDSSQNPSRKRPLEDSDAPKKKYKKRLRKIRENASKAKDDKEQDAPSYSSSSESSDDELRTTILEANVDVGPYDVIMGRGRGNLNHPGNQNLINIFRLNKVRYGISSKLQKTRIAREIVATIHKQGGRFLKRHDDDRWEIISNSYAYRKVCHGIRDLRENEKHLVDYVRMEERDDPKVTKKKPPTDARETLIPPPNRQTTEAFAASLSANFLEAQPSSKSEQEVTTLTKRDGLDGGSEETTMKRAESAVSAGEFSGNEMQDPTISERPLTESSTKPHRVSYKAGDPVEPRAEDVVCGRGKALNRHPGNQLMHEVVKKYKYLYRDARNQEEKAKIANKVMSAIHNNGGRLLRLNDKGQWYELDYKVGMNKIYHSIRDSLYNCDGKRMKEPDDADDDGDPTQKDDDSEPERPGGQAASILPGKSKEAAVRHTWKWKPPPPRELPGVATDMQALYRDASVIDARHRTELERGIRAQTDAILRQGVGGGVAMEDRPPFYSEKGLENISDPQLRARLARGMADPLIRAQIIQQDLRLQRAGQGVPPGMMGMQGYLGGMGDLPPSMMRTMGAHGNSRIGGMGLQMPNFHGMEMGRHINFAGSTATSAANTVPQSLRAPLPSATGPNLQEEMRRMMFSRYGV